MTRMAQASPAGPALAGSASQAGPAGLPGPLGPPGSPRAPESPVLWHRRVRLSTGSAAAAYACDHVRAAVTEWRIPVDARVAGILASDLIINAVSNGAAETLMLSIRCSASQFRVEVHDASVTGDSWEAPASDANADRGLLLAAFLAADSGHFRTPAGRAVYYALAFAPAAGASQTPRGTARGGGEP